MEYLEEILAEKKIETDKVKNILDESLFNKDFFSKDSLNKLTKTGLTKKESLSLLTHYKSQIKYEYKISPKTVEHLFDLAKSPKAGSALKHLSESPFFLVKASWIFEHSPFFIFYNNYTPEDQDELIITFANDYDKHYLNSSVSFASWEKNSEAKRVKTVSFWENRTFDPVILIKKALDEGIQGVELSVDFHPFNYFKLLPEEISKEKRAEIKKACQISGIQIDIHSPIIGPYSPSSDPKVGSQNFFNPLNCIDLMKEVIDLGKDIGAGSIVIHLIESNNIDKMVELIQFAAGSRLRITLENYCQTGKKQDSSAFIDYIRQLVNALPRDIKYKNFGITLDVGHLNIEGEDPLIASEKIGRFCLDNEIFIRVHATDNYGKLLFSPPAYSADVHGNVNGRGINNKIIIKLLRSMGHRFDVVAEQIQPLSEDDKTVINEAQTHEFADSYENILDNGRKIISEEKQPVFITPDIVNEKAYAFLASIEGISALKEHLVYRKIQDQKYLSVDEAKRISQDFMRMPHKYRGDLIEYIDSLLLPIQSERGIVQKSEIDLICNNISGALFGTINNEHLNLIFSKTKKYNAGEIICKQGTFGKEMYFIKEGEAEVYINGDIIATLSPGEIFGEISLFYNIKRTATIKASRKTTTLGILTREGFELILQSGEPYSFDLIYRLFNILPERLRNLNDKYKTAMNALDYLFKGEKNNIPVLEYEKSDIANKFGIALKLSREEITKLFKNERHYNENELIFTEGEKGNGAYLIIKGRVKAVTFSQKYDEIVLGELGEGEVFGEMALIDDKPRSASIVALEPSVMVFVDKHAFDKLIDNRSQIALHLMSFICLSLFRRILNLDRIYAELKRAFG